MRMILRSNTDLGCSDPKKCVHFVNFVESNRIELKRVWWCMAINSFFVALCLG